MSKCACGGKFPIAWYIKHTEHYCKTDYSNPPPEPGYEARLRQAEELLEWCGEQLVVIGLENGSLVAAIGKFLSEKEKKETP